MDTRPPLQRMLHIHQSIKTGTYPNASVLARELEVCTKSVHRDIEFMRDRLELPLEFDAYKRGYHYTEEVGAFPNLHITEGELVALVVAEKALEQYRGTTFEKPLLSAVQKLEQAMPDTISVNLEDVHQTISFRTRAAPILDLVVFNKLAQATAGRRQLEIAYRKPGQREPELRRIDPYHLANINGEWFLFAFDHLRQDIRTFVPARMKSVRQTGKTFPKPQKFSLENRLRDSFGVHSGQGRFEVVIRFDARVADYIREKKWHDSQDMKELNNGGVELKLTLSSLAEIERWVLDWGGSAVVIRPAELVESVKRAAKEILEKHA